MKPSVIDRDRVAQVRQALDSMTGEIPSTSGGGGKGGHSDRVGSLAFRQHIDPEDPDRGERADVARKASDRIDWLETEIIRRGSEGASTRRLVRQLDDELARWEPLTQWMRDGLQTETAGKGDDGCVSCVQVKDSLGRPLHNTRHDGLDVCQQCYRDLKRVHARPKYEDVTLVPAVVLRWRQRHPATTRLTDVILDGLLDGRIVA